MGIVTLQFTELQAKALELVLNRYANVLETTLTLTQNMNLDRDKVDLTIQFCDSVVAMIAMSQAESSTIH